MLLPLPRRAWSVHPKAFVIVCLAVAQAAAGADLASCRSIADDRARLRCFDEIDRAPSAVAVPAPPLPAPPLPPAPTPADAAPAAATRTSRAPAAASAAVPPVDSFGAVALPKKPPEEPKTITAKLMGAVDGVRRGQVLPLDNGQIWLVIDDREFEYLGSNPAVQLERNLIGSYWMRILDGGPRFKVRRTQ